MRGIPQTSSNQWLWWKILDFNSAYFCRLKVFRNTDVDVNIPLPVQHSLSWNLWDCRAVTQWHVIDILTVE
jgi:hypothetical protein